VADTTGAISSADGSVIVGAGIDTIILDPGRLLEVDVRYEGWLHQTAPLKAFYVRGFTWFRERVIPNKIMITDIPGAHINRMKEIIASRPAWQSLPFDWREKFGSRQFIDSASPKILLTPKFQKAVEIIVLCEAAAEAIHARDPSCPPPAEVYSRMRIEPAVSYLHGFDRSTLENLINTHGDRFLDDMRRWTGQKSATVFYDMADGATVTHKLVIRLHRLLKARYLGGRIGEPDYRYNPSRKYRPSRNEDIDVKESTLPPEAQFS
jgi:hypothetical protein